MHFQNGGYATNEIENEQLLGPGQRPFRAAGMGWDEIAEKMYRTWAGIFRA